LMLELRKCKEGNGFGMERGRSSYSKQAYVARLIPFDIKIDWCFSLIKMF
jgi:hypothetical protein